MNINGTFSPLLMQWRCILELSQGFGAVFEITNGCQNQFVELEVKKMCHFCRLKRKAKRVIKKETTKEHSGLTFSFLNTNIT